MVEIRRNDLSQWTFFLFEKYNLFGDFTDYYLSDIENGYKYSKNSEFQKVYNFNAKKDKIFAGSISLILDSRLNKNSCYFGFFEVINDKEVFEALWEQLTDFAKSLNIEKILGPVNGTIWHQYRVVSKNFTDKYFPSEPITRSFYYDFLKSKNPTHQEEYHSAYRTNFDVIMQHTKESYDNAFKNGIIIEKVINFDLELMKVLYAFSKQIFSKNWGFVPLNFNEFIELYNTDKLENFIGSVHLAKINSQIIGFCLNIETDDSLIMKTIAVVPEYQQKGVGNALVYAVHDDAKKNKKDYVIYALINKKNKIQHFPKDEVSIMREYVAFEFKI